MMADRIFGVVVLVSAAVVFIDQALRAVIANPGAWGLAIAVSTISTGVFACRSIIRDRLS